MAFHVGIDVGGTFTDLFALDVTSGRAIAEKADTTADVVEGLMAVLDKAAIPSGDIASLVFGSTLATNALIEGETAPVAFLGTAGFTDSLEVRRLWREHLFGWRWERPKALVPHALRLPIGGRIGGPDLLESDLETMAVFVAGCPSGPARGERGLVIPGERVFDQGRGLVRELRPHPLDEVVEIFDSIGVYFN